MFAQCINSDKTTVTFFTPHPAEYNYTLNIQVNNTIIPTQKLPKILGLTFDPKLTYSEHIKTSTDKAKRTLNILKALTSTKWEKQKEIIIQTYKAITRPILEYGNTIWGPIISQTNINKIYTDNTKCSPPNCDRVHRRH